MAFPSTPTNGQTVTIGAITYSYDSSRNVWKRVASEVATLTPIGVTPGSYDSYIPVLSVDNFGRITSISNGVSTSAITQSITVSNTANSLATTANTLSHLSFQKSNTISILAQAAFDRANTGGIGTANVQYTVSTSSPASPSLGDKWYNLSNDVLYEYSTDGTSSFWSDISSSTFSTAVNEVASQQSLNDVQNKMESSYSKANSSSNLAQAAYNKANNSRTTITVTTPSLSTNANSRLDITGYKSYALQKVFVDGPAWIRLYTSNEARINDYGRLRGSDPTNGSGIISEVITTQQANVWITPATIGFNADEPTSNTMYLSITNLGSTACTTVKLTVLPLEL